jgi:hypothetical protein
MPLPQCRSTVERADDGYSEAFQRVNPGFFAKPTPEDLDAAFDVRDEFKRASQVPTPADARGRRRRRIGGYWSDDSQLHRICNSGFSARWK